MFKHLLLLGNVYLAELENVVIFKVIATLTNFIYGDFTTKISAGMHVCGRVNNITFSRILG